MNELTNNIERIIDVVVSSCITTITINGDELVTREEILSHSRKQNAVKARHILAYALHRYGYTTSTICGLLKCTPSAVSKMISQHESYKQTNKAYMLACRSIKRVIEDAE